MALLRGSEGRSSTRGEFASAAEPGVRGNRLMGSPSAVRAAELRMETSENDEAPENPWGRRRCGLTQVFPDLAVSVRPMSCADSRFRGGTGGPQRARVFRPWGGFHAEGNNVRKNSRFLQSIGRIGRSYRQSCESLGGSRRAAAKRSRSMSQGDCDLLDLVRSGQRFALALTHHPDSAADLLQDAWFRVLKAQGPWNRPYLFAAIRTQFCERGGRLHPPSVDGRGDEAPAARADALGELAETNGHLGEALGTLSSSQRAVLYLSVVEGLSASEIAELLQWPRGTILSTLHRAKGQLRSVLENPQ